MVEVRDIERLVDEIVRRFSPERIILFGSYAYGVPTPDSDVDLLVVRNYRGRTLDAITRVRQAVNPPFPLDVLVRSPREVADRLAEPDVFTRLVVEQGIVLYDAIDQRVGRQGRRRLRNRCCAATVAQA